MIVYRIAKEKWLGDLSGKGAKLPVGRWNPKGYPLLYCASTSSLAILEKLVNIDFDLLPSDLHIAEIEVPQSSLKSLSPSELPKNWNRYPSPDTFKRIGQKWIDANVNLLLEVPSAVNPRESNYLINTQHELMNRVKIVESYPIFIDERLRS
ncbi:MAG: RES family NAD+ phosphorylase [Bacteroidetes bacterium]|nr:RES family NAD+ phosphorylase [Bacteroidota bacterium]